MVIHSTFPDFILFLYIHVAHSDNSYDPREFSTIKSKMTGLFPSGTDMEKKLYQAIREYNKFDQAKINDLCVDTMHHFGSDGESTKLQLFRDAEEIMNSDGTINELEKETLRRLKELVEAQTT